MASPKQEHASPTEAGKPNRLIDETSPYLLQHAFNPVDWYPWGPAAIEKAKAENMPILLSIGYSACHWCHVMEYESFENAEIAKAMNENFVNIKVDREERPDLDDIYMKSVQLMTGHGGWPMTVFLTPDLKPFFGGTYFPPEDRHGMPGFKRVLQSVAHAWKSNRDQIDASSDELARYLNLFDQIEEHEGGLDWRPVVAAVDHMGRVFDAEWGGFGGAPKFPFPCTISLAMRALGPNVPIDDSKRRLCHEIITTTLDRMAYGGMHDQIGGGFARYSVDKKWLVPHFEKMLYDNATLSTNYFDGHLLLGRDYWRKVGQDCLDFVERELKTPEGAFYSSLDADSEGEEGKFYVFKPEEIVDILGKEDGSWVNEVYGVTIDGNFEHGTSVLHLTDSPEHLCRRYEISVEEFWSRLDPLRSKLLAARANRVRPGRDEKVLTSWNALMISGFVAGYKATDERRYLDTARGAGAFLLSDLKLDGRLLRTYGKGRAKLNGYLDDYAFLIQALLDLSEVDFDPRWYREALVLCDCMLRHFWDEDKHTFFYTSDDHETLVTRPKSYYDGSIPSATSVAVMCLLRLSKLAGNEEYRSKAERVLERFAPHFGKSPDQFANMICALDFYLASGVEIAVVADISKPGWEELMRNINHAYLPNSVVLLKDVGNGARGEGKVREDVPESPLLAGRKLVENKPTVYLCRNFTCDKPITEPATLESKLNELGAS